MIRGDPMRGSLSAARAVLRSMGFEITGERILIRRGGFEISDVDLMASKDGEMYAVEVKSGRLDVGGVRQAYVNALLVGARPMVVCRGFADPSAEALAGELGVEVVELDDVFLSDPEELRSLIREEVRRAMLEVLPSILRPPELESEDVEVLRAISEAMTFTEAAKILGMNEEELGRSLGKMRGLGKIPKWIRDFSQLREWSRSLLRSRGETFSLEKGDNRG